MRRSLALSFIAIRLVEIDYKSRERNFKGTVYWSGGHNFFEILKNSRKKNVRGIMRRSYTASFTVIGLLKVYCKSGGRSFCVRSTGERDNNFSK